MSSLNKSINTQATSSPETSSSGRPKSTEEKDNNDSAGNTGEIDSKDGKCRSESARGVPSCGPLLLSEAMAEFWKGGWSEAILKLLLKLEKQCKIEGIRTLIEMQRKYIVDGDVDQPLGQNFDGSNMETVKKDSIDFLDPMEWEAMAKSLSAFGYVDFGKMIRTCKADSLSLAKEVS